MQIMIEKGLVVRDESRWSHVYEVAVPAEETQRQLVRDLLIAPSVDRPSNWSCKRCLPGRACREELGEIRRLIDQLEKRT